MKPEQNVARAYDIAKPEQNAARVYGTAKPEQSAARVYGTAKPEQNAAHVYGTVKPKQSAVRAYDIARLIDHHTWLYSITLRITLIPRFASSSLISSAFIAWFSSVFLLKISHKRSRNRSKTPRMSTATENGGAAYLGRTPPCERERAGVFFRQTRKRQPQKRLPFPMVPKIVSVGYVGKQCHLTRSLDCGGELSLMKSAGAANASRKDLRSFGNEFPKFGNILVIDLVHLVLAEEAYFLSSVHRTEGGTGCIVSFHVGKNLSGSPYRIPSRVVSLTHEGGRALSSIRREGSRRPGSLRNWSPACC